MTQMFERDAAWRAEAFRSLGMRLSTRLDAGAVVSNLTLDSRIAAESSVFCARQGATTDGHSFLSLAAEAGTRVFIVTDESRLPESWSYETWVGALDDKSLHPIAAAFYDQPLTRLMVAGVTGTNGKTSVTNWASQLVSNAGGKPATIGTLGFSFRGSLESGPNTTPDPLTLHRWAARAVSLGADCLIMEVSSHALVLNRVLPAMFDVVAFTSFGSDHLDFHKTLDNYLAAKLQLFEHGLRGSGAVIVWEDDPKAAEFIKVAPGDAQVMSAGSAESSQLRVEQVALLGGSQTLRFAAGGASIEVDVEALGSWVAANAGVAVLVAAAVTRQPAIELASRVAELEPIPGRLEPVAPGLVPTLRAYVDYAHTADALSRALESLRTDEPLSVVFGCGGDRDRLKRPEMGEVAAAGADWVCVTSDNPRGEDPEAIISEVLEPVVVQDHVHAEESRREAIEEAVQRDGVLLIAGKGHEQGQQIGRKNFLFNDRHEVQRALWARRRGTPPREAPWLWGWSARELSDIVGGRFVQGSPRAPLGSLCTDTRALHPGDVFFAIRGERFDAHDFLGVAAAAGASCLVIERGAASSLPDSIAVVEVDSSVAALAKLARAILKYSRGSALEWPVVGLTGSNGKTTTKNLSGSIMTELLGGPVLSTIGNLNNDIGLPLSVSNAAPIHKGAILEMGASQSGDIARLAEVVQPDFCAVTSIGPAHLEGLGSVDGIRRAKSQILAGGKTQAFVLPFSESRLPVWQDAIRDLADLGPDQVLTVGAQEGATLRYLRPDPIGPLSLIGDNDGPLAGYEVELDFMLPGLHHAGNLGTALLCAWLASGRGSLPTAERLSELLASSQSAQGRWSLQSAAGHQWIDDAYNANPASTLAALELLGGLQGVRVAMLAEMGELGPRSAELHREVGEAAAASAEIVVGVGVGEGVEQLVSAAQADGAVTYHCGSPAEAAVWAMTQLTPGATILLKGSRSAALERVLEEVRRSEEDN